LLCSGQTQHMLEQQLKHQARGVKDTRGLRQMQQRTARDRLQLGRQGRKATGQPRPGAAVKSCDRVIPEVKLYSPSFGELWLVLPPNRYSAPGFNITHANTTTRTCSGSEEFCSVASCFWWRRPNSGGVTVGPGLPVCLSALAGC
jgi:hypothetical protein